MSDPYGTQYMAVAGTDPEHHHHGSGWIWGILLFLILAAAIVFLVLWLWERGRSKDQKELTLTGTEFTLTTSNSMQATWTGSGDDSDQVILHVYKTGETIKFNPDGSPTSATVGNVVASSSTVSATTRTVTAGPLTAGVAYTGVLIITNSDISNAHGSVTGTSLLPGGGPEGAIHIVAIGQPGEIKYDISASTPTVGYNFSGNTSPDNSLFHHDPDDLLCTVMLSQNGPINLNNTTRCGDLGSGTHVLYDPSPTSSTTALGIKQYETSDATNTNAQWSYSSSNNRWCLKGNTNKCLEISDFIDVTTETATINIISTPASATTWHNPNFSLSST